MCPHLIISGKLINKTHWGLLFTWRWRISIREAHWVAHWRGIRWRWATHTNANTTACWSHSYNYTTIANNILWLWLLLVLLWWLLLLLLLWLLLVWLMLHCLSHWLVLYLKYSNVVLIYEYTIENTFENKKDLKKQYLRDITLNIYSKTHTQNPT